VTARGRRAEGETQADTPEKRRMKSEPTGHAEDWQPVIHTPLDNKEDIAQLVAYNLQETERLLEHPCITDPFRFRGVENAFELCRASKRNGLIVTSIEVGKGFEFEYTYKPDAELSIRTPLELSGTVQHLVDPNLLQCYDVTMRLMAVDLIKPKSGQLITRIGPKLSECSKRFPYAGAFDDSHEPSIRPIWTSQPQAMTNRKMGRFRFILKGDEIPELNKEVCENCVFCVQIVATFVPRRGKLVKEALDSLKIESDFTPLSEIALPVVLSRRHDQQLYPQEQAEYLDMTDFQTPREVVLMEISPLVLTFQKGVSVPRKPKSK
jgi:hypothetical protein